MKLEKFNDESYEFSGEASKLIRQFAFAGIAIIWIFKFDQPLDHLLPKELIIPLICLIITLFFDLMQYLISGLIWTLFFRYHEKKIMEEQILK